MNDDIAWALLDFAEILYKAVDAIAEDPERTADGLVLLISAIEAAVEKYGSNQYEDSDRQIVRSLIDLAATEMAGLALVAGTVTLLAPGAGVVAIAVATVAAGEMLGQWLDTNRISFFPSVQDASSSTYGVTLYGYAPLGDTLTSSTHDDRVFGFSGNDYIANTGGSDAVFGGRGQDTLDYSTINLASPNGIVVDATAGDGSFVVHHNSDTERSSTSSELRSQMPSYLATMARISPVAGISNPSTQALGMMSPYYSTKAAQGRDECRLMAGLASTSFRSPATISIPRSTSQTAPCGIKAA